MLALFPLHVYESTSQARFIAKVPNQGDMLILPFFFVLAGLMNLQQYLQSFALSSQIHISSGWHFRQSLWAIGKQLPLLVCVPYVNDNATILAISEIKSCCVFFNGYLIVFKQTSTAWKKKLFTTS